MLSFYIIELRNVAKEQRDQSMHLEHLWWFIHVPTATVIQVHSSIAPFPPSPFAFLLHGA